MQPRRIYSFSEEVVLCIALFDYRQPRGNLILGGIEVLLQPNLTISQVRRTKRTLIFPNYRENMRCHDFRPFLSGVDSYFFNDLISLPRGDLYFERTFTRSLVDVHNLTFFSP